MDVPAGHDAWVVGDEPVVTLEWVGVHGWASPRSGERVLATLVFTDIVDSTRLAERVGDTAWNRLMDDHNLAVRRALEQYRGREVDTTGDGVFAMFDGAERAVRAALAIRRSLRALDLEIRIGIHTGEVELLPGDAVRGVAVHVAARVMSLAHTGEILLSGTTLELIDERGLTFEDRGRHELKGVSGPRQLFALASES
jgi:class 3 adenylate cyclase